jgi:hypothetical protein
MTDRIAFPAWPGTTIVDEEGIEDQVLGWVTTDNGLAAITLNGQRRMIGGWAINLPEGITLPSPLSKMKAARQAEHAKTKAAQTPAQERDAEAHGQTSLTPSIQFTAKPFKTSSWWRYTDGSFDFMFEVPPEQDAPKKTDECQKIKREEFTDWKKEGVPVELYVDVKEGRVDADEGGEESEPEGDDDEDLI